MSAARRHAEIAEILWLLDSEDESLDKHGDKKLYESLNNSKKFLIIFGLSTLTPRHQNKVLDYYNSLCALDAKKKVFNLFVCT